MNGLETGLAIAAVSWTLFLFYQNTSKKYSYIRWIIIGILPFIRPELVILSALIIARYSIYDILNGQKKDLLSTKIVPIIIVLFSFFLIVSLISFFGGSLFPETIDAKKYFFAEYCNKFDKKLNVVANGVWVGLKSWGFLSASILFTFFSPFKYIFTIFFLYFFLNI